MYHQDELAADFYLARVFDMNQPTLAVMFRPRGKERNDKICLNIVGRPYSHQGKAQGDHTMAWGAMARSLEWLFKSVTLEEAVSNIEILHRGFNAIRSSLSVGETLISSLDAYHKTITKGPCARELILLCITEYLIHYCYIRNAQPEASVHFAKNSGGKGEGSALKNLSTVEYKLKTGCLPPSPEVQADIVQNLSTLFDKNAIWAYVKNSSTTGREESLQRILSYQLFGLHEVLLSLPHTRKLLLKGDLLTAGNQRVPDELLSHLAAIILYRKDEEITEVGHRKNKDHIRQALVSIAKSTV